MTGWIVVSIVVAAIFSGLAAELGLYSRATRTAPRLAAFIVVAALASSGAVAAGSFVRAHTSSTSTVYEECFEYGLKYERCRPLDSPRVTENANTQAGITVGVIVLLIIAWGPGAWVADRFDRRGGAA